VIQTPQPIRPKPTQPERFTTADGCTFERTNAGGWILVRHPRKRMLAPGIIAVDGRAGR
jgi:hypothetical protein